MANLFYKGNKKRSIITKTVGLVVSAAMMVTMVTPGTAFALRGDSGYEGGISEGENPSLTSTATSTSATSKIQYKYQEPFFLTGVPIVLTGTMTITKKLKTDTKTGVQTLTTTYNYNVPNANNNSLTRAIELTTTITPRENGQKTETTKLASASETLKLNGVNYSISKSNPNDYMISKAITNDYQPAVSYFAGTLIGKKTYHIGNSADTIVVDSTCNTVGYDEYWSTAEAQTIKQTITQNKAGQAPLVLGNASINVSTTTTKQLKYYENQPEQISFEGGYYKTQYNENVLKYTADLKELDKGGAPTSKTNTYTNSLKLESFPFNDPLVAPNLKKIKGHPAEESMAIMFGLEAYKDIDHFNPQEYMSRGEFIDAFTKVAPAVPLDPVFKPKTTTTTTSSRKKTPVVLLFKDVPEKSKYFASINDAANRGIISKGGNFRPDSKITLAEVITMTINSLGLSNLAPNPSPVTSFKDNDKIPSYARAPMYVAEKIGLIQGDSKGYIYPTAKITKANAARIMKAYIDYMNSGIREEYMDRILSY